MMFLCALARPRYNNITRQWFDGLIGIYPVGEFDMYKRGSRYHARGDLKWTNFTLDRDEYQRMMVKFVLPDIKRKMPMNNNIIVQQEQDGATAHLPVDDPVFKAKVEQLYYGNETSSITRSKHERSWILCFLLTINVLQNSTKRCYGAN
jgi:hypothetical protein